MEIFCQFAFYFYLLNTLFMYCLSEKKIFLSKSLFRPLEVYGFCFEIYWLALGKWFF